jgi:hypothetical protein
MWESSRRGKRSWDEIERRNRIKRSWLHNLYKFDECSDGGIIRPTPLIDY